MVTAEHERHVKRVGDFPPLNYEMRNCANCGRRVIKNIYGHRNCSCRKGVTYLAPSVTQIKLAMRKLELHRLSVIGLELDARDEDELKRATATKRKRKVKHGNNRRAKRSH